MSIPVGKCLYGPYGGSSATLLGPNGCVIANETIGQERERPEIGLPTGSEWLTSACPAPTCACVHAVSYERWMRSASCDSSSAASVVVTSGDWFVSWFCAVWIWEIRSPSCPLTSAFLLITSWSEIMISVNR